MFNKKYLLIMFLGIFLITFTTALKVNIPVVTNISTASVNDSYYLRGLSPQQVANLFDASGYYLKSNPFSFYNSTTLPLETDTISMSYLNETFNNTKEPTGFSEQGVFTSSLLFNDSNRTFSICANPSYVIYFKGKKITKTGCDSLIIPNDAGYTNYIYFDGVTGETLTQSTSPWGNDFSNTIQVATVFWNGSNGLIGKERHGITMDSSTHYYLHTTVGTRYVSGFTGQFTNPSNWNLTAGIIADEDNIDTNPAQSGGRIFYHTATGRYTFTPNQTRLYYNISNIVQYDSLTGTTNVPVAGYVAYWFVESVDRDTPTYIIMGQRTDTTLANAQANNKWESMSLSTLDIPEYKLLYRVILKRQGTSIPTTEDVLDLRSVSNLPSGTYVATSHSSLTGLTNDDHLQYLRTDGTRLLSANWNQGAFNFTNTSSWWFGQSNNHYNKTQMDNGTWIKKNTNIEFYGKNATGMTIIDLLQIAGACPLTINGSICSNATGTYIVG